MLASARRKSRADRVTTEYLRYGEDAPDAVDHNLRGQVWRVFDQAGMVASEAHDYRGNLIESTRRLTQAYTGAVDWTALAEATTEEDRDDEADALLYAEVFTTTSTFDALGRPVETHPPRSSDGARATTHARTVRMAYNQSGLLARVEVQLGTDEAAFGTYVDSITYNARRQRTGIVYGNGVETALSYDAESFRLTRLYTAREVATDTLVGQDLRYAYDAVGNITRMDDHAVMVDDEERMVHAGPQLAEPVVHAYTYDALDRLIAATGREHPGLLPTTTPLQPGSSGYDRGGPHPNDLAALEDYVEQYAYDAVGNFLTMQHAVPSETTHSWTRHYLYEGIGNRLTKTHGGNATGTGSYSYGYDDHGNMLAMPHLAEMDWNAYDELTRTDNGGGAGRVEHHFQYDASGQRVRKVVEHYTSDAATLIEERVYFGGYELYRRHQGAGTGLDKEVVRELQTLHVMDGEQRVALVDTRTVEMAPEDEEPTVLAVEARTTRVVYQLGNHLGSACLEVDADGEVVRYEEFHPYGSSALLYAREGEDDAPKRYRFTGMECDDTGLQYHSARYYAPWLGRWTSPDPLRPSIEINMFAYCNNEPVGWTDSHGKQQRDPQVARVTEQRSGAPVLPVPQSQSSELSTEVDRSIQMEMMEGSLPASLHTDWVMNLLTRASNHWLTSHGIRLPPVFSDRARAQLRCGMVDTVSDQLGGDALGRFIFATWLNGARVVGLGTLPESRHPESGIVMPMLYLGEGTTAGPGNQYVQRYMARHSPQAAVFDDIRSSLLGLQGSGSFELSYDNGNGNNNTTMQWSRSEITEFSALGAYLLNGGRLDVRVDYTFLDANRARVVVHAAWIDVIDRNPNIGLDNITAPIASRELGARDFGIVVQWRSFGTFVRSSSESPAAVGEYHGAWPRPQSERAPLRPNSNH